MRTQAVLRSLDSSGLVEQVPNRGVFVRTLTAQQACDGYDVRAVLFGLAGKLLAERITDEGIVRLRAFVADMDVAAGADDFESYVKVNFAFHEFIVESTCNPTLAQQYLTLVKQLRLYRARSVMPGHSMHASISNITPWSMRGLRLIPGAEGSPHEQEKHINVDEMMIGLPSSRSGAML